MESLQSPQHWGACWKLFVHCVEPGHPLAASATIHGRAIGDIRCGSGGAVLAKMPIKI
ncbi:hypothetical protein LMG18090_02184 [Ralstonia mannitolilytica]|nr:hypothetical protein LMG18090_02184 [Ralstonia mannitolilytica]